MITETKKQLKEENEMLSSLTECLNEINMAINNLKDTKEYQNEVINKSRFDFSYGVKRRNKEVLLNKTQKKIEYHSFKGVYDLKNKDAIYYYPTFDPIVLWQDIFGSYKESFDKQNSVAKRFGNFTRAFLLTITIVAPVSVGISYICHKFASLVNKQKAKKVQKGLEELKTAYESQVSKFNCDLIKKMSFLKETKFRFQEELQEQQEKVIKLEDKLIELEEKKQQDTEENTQENLEEEITM